MLENIDALLQDDGNKVDDSPVEDASIFPELFENEFVQLANVKVEGSLPMEFERVLLVG